MWTIDRSDVSTALRPYMLAPSWVSGTYVAANLAALAVVVAAWGRSDLPALEAIADICLGTSLGYVLLVPVHEGLHALAYRTLGAEDVRVVYRWRSLAAYCVAARSVVGRNGLAWVSVAPFAVLNPILAAAALLTSGVWAVLLAGALLLHVGACGGDFGLLNWLWLRGRSDTLSYDDLSDGRSYFFVPAVEPAAVFVVERP